MPFAHFCIDWEGINLSDWSFQSDNIDSIVNSVDWTEEMNEEGGYNVDICTPPDPGFNQRQCSSAELQQTADLKAETDKESTPTPNPFLDLVAIESSEEIPKSKNHALIYLSLILIKIFICEYVKFNTVNILVYFVLISHN